MAKTARALCTIATLDHLGAAGVLAESLHRHADDPPPLHVFVVDGEPIGAKRAGFKERVTTSRVIAGRQELVELAPNEPIETLYAKYQGDALRWSLKTCALRALLTDHGYESVFYLDCDLYFVDAWEFLFKELETTGALLSPHWRPLLPESDEEKHQFRSHMTHGFFNAGFVGFSKQGLEALQWWQASCLRKCERAPENGLWDDQRYLDVLPAYFGDTCRVLQHKGCNVSVWNRSTLTRTIREEQISIAGDPLVFLHLNPNMLRLAETHDPLLYPFTVDYTRRRDEFDKYLGGF